MNCWVCNAELIWGGDHDIEEENENNMLKDLDSQLEKIIEKTEKYKIETMFNDKKDHFNCFLEIHAGAGGTEAQDWAMMLQRMYFRWAEKKGFSVKLI